MSSSRFANTIGAFRAVPKAYNKRSRSEKSRFSDELDEENAVEPFRASWGFEPRSESTRLWVSGQDGQQGNPHAQRRHTEAQIEMEVLNELDAGRPAAELARKYGVHVNTLRLAQQYGGLDISDLSRLKELETENAQMERIIARQALEIRAMTEVIRKNGWGPQRAKKR